jgi:hypothetical protein
MRATKASVQKVASRHLVGDYTDLKPWLLALLFLARASISQ